MKEMNMIEKAKERGEQSERVELTRRVPDEILLEPTSIVLVGIPLSWPKRLKRANYIFRILERMFFTGKISKEEIEQIYRKYLEIAEKAFNGLTALDSRLLYFSLDDWAKLNDDYQTKKMLLNRRGATIVRPVNHVVAKLGIIMKLFARARRTISFSNNIEALEHLRSLQVEFLTKLTEINNELLDKYNLRPGGTGGRMQTQKVADEDQIASEEQSRTEEFTSQGISQDISQKKSALIESIQTTQIQTEKNIEKDIEFEPSDFFDRLR